MIRSLAPDTFAVACDKCGAAGIGAEAEPGNARRMAALLGWQSQGERDLCPRCTSVRPPPSIFALGQLLATPAIVRGLTVPQIAGLIGRHRMGDWGDVCNEDAQANAMALQEGARIISVYHVVLVGDDAAEATKVWIITEADRSATTVLFPEEY